MMGYKQDAERYGACQAELSALRRRIAELERLNKDSDLVAMRERLEYYRIQNDKNDAEIARLKALINELQKIINELTAWKDTHQGATTTYAHLSPHNIHTTQHNTVSYTPVPPPSLTYICTLPSNTPQLHPYFKPPETIPPPNPPSPPTSTSPNVSPPPSHSTPPLPLYPYSLFIVLLYFH